MPAYKGKAQDSPFSGPGVGGATFGTLTAEAANARTQSIQLTDDQGRSVTGFRTVHVWLTTNSDGSDVAGVAATSLTAGTNGKKLSDLTVGKIAVFQSDAQGRIDVTINDAAVRSVYLVVQTAGGLSVSGAIAFA